MMIASDGYRWFGKSTGALVEFGILGPVEVRIGDRVADVGHSKRRAVLAVLLLDLGRAVPAELLIDKVWGEQPPVTVNNAMYGYLARLRKVIATAAEPQVQLTRSAGGYLLRAPAERLDLNRFRRLIADAATADDAQSAVMLREALRLWRGPALAGLDSPWLRAMRQTLESERATAVLDLNEVRLRLGEHATLVSELSEQAVSCPTDERLTGQLMLALYRCGRQAEALGLFERTRAQLASELGADPGPELRSLHQQILRADPSLTAPVPAGSGPAGTAWIAAAPAPRHLPPDVTAFTGRAAELARLDRLIGTASAATAVIAAISGTAGIGKTALALHWAHRAAGRFGDGQLYVNLRGFDPSGAPATPAEAIRGFLDALGVPLARIPQTTQAQAGLYRSLLADKRMLIVLDNARDENQVRPLLPASPGSLVIITSRNQLAGLAVADGAQLVSLDVLTHPEAIRLLSARIGTHRAAAEPEAVDEIAALCAHLPLALALTAARAATRPRFPLAQLAAELRVAPDRLDTLDVGDPAASVSAVFSWSYEQLGPSSARMFRLLGLHPGPDISIPAAASLAGTGRAEACRLLRDLARGCLVTEHAPGRYAFHDLLRRYAASQARDNDSQPDRDAAIGRVLDHYLHTASHSSALLQPSREPLLLTPPGPGTCPERPRDHRQAIAWFEAEHQVLHAAIALAADTGADSHAWQLPWAMSGYLLGRGYLQERVTHLGRAVAAATRLDDLLAQAMALRALGRACTEAGDYDQARVHLERCLSLYQRLGDRRGEARAQQNLSVLAGAQGRSADALGHNEHALRLVQAIGHTAAEAEILNNGAWYHALLGNYQEAREFCEQSQALIAKLDRCNFEHAVWDTLGYIELRLGNFARAAGHFEFALGACRDYGDRYGEAAILTHVGDARHGAGELSRARQAWQQALAIYDDIRHPDADEIRAKLAECADQPCAGVGLPPGQRNATRSTRVTATRLGRPSRQHDRQTLYRQQEPRVRSLLKLLSLTDRGASYLTCETESRCRSPRSPGTRPASAPGCSA